LDVVVRETTHEVFTARFIAVNRRAAMLSRIDAGYLILQALTRAALPAVFCFLLGNSRIAPPDSGSGRHRPIGARGDLDGFPTGMFLLTVFALWQWGSMGKLDAPQENGRWSCCSYEPSERFTWCGAGNRGRVDRACRLRGHVDSLKGQLV
jgi:hypothetical protein